MYRYGGATAWRFDLDADVQGNKAKGTFRMNINALSCNTGRLSWEAVALLIEGTGNKTGLRNFCCWLMFKGKASNRCKCMVQ